MSTTSEQRDLVMRCLYRDEPFVFCSLSKKGGKIVGTVTISHCTTPEEARALIRAVTNNFYEGGEK